MERQVVSAEAFIRLREEANWKIVDVRSPGEYEAGHIPGAESIPLFDDEERAEIGTLYKHQGREAALLKGLDLAGPKLSAFVRAADAVAPERKLLVHCWRGGMRSKSLATLWKQAGFEVMTLEGGYKAFRHLVRQVVNRPCQLRVLGGMTGSGKTAILHELAAMGEQMIDLEGLAHHKGSAFGAIGEQPQPSTEQFENNLFEVMRKMDPQKPVWIEDESRMIGKVFVPEELWKQLHQAPLIKLDLPRQIRIQRLVEDYADGDPAEARMAIQRIAKRMDGLAVKQAISALEQGDYATTADLVLDYYDRYYLKSLEKRNPKTVLSLNIDHTDPALAAREVLKLQPDPPKLL